MICWQSHSLLPNAPGIIHNFLNQRAYNDNTLILNEMTRKISNERIARNKRWHFGQQLGIEGGMWPMTKETRMAQKLTHIKVDFEHPAKGPAHCAQCEHYTVNSCEIVRSPVGPRDWCNRFKKAK